MKDGPNIPTHTAIKLPPGTKLRHSQTNEVTDGDGNVLSAATDSAVMNALIERVAKAIDAAYSPSDLSWEKCALAAVAATFNDPDIRELMAWLDFKQSGKPDTMWDGARKLLEAIDGEQRPS